VISFDAPGRGEVCREVAAKLKTAYPELSFEIAADIDFGEVT